jgi:sugar lactone lactonase YvrE
MTTAVQFTEACCQHGEGPVWDNRSGRLALVDMLRGDVLFADQSGTVTRRHVGVVAAALRPRASGGWVLAIERGFAFGDAHLTEIDALEPLWTDADIRMNDGACDATGRFFCGSLASDGRPGAGRLYRFGSGGRPEAVLDQVTVSNGLGWSPDGRTAYYVDSATQRIDAFDYDQARGEFTHRRPLAEIAPSDGVPDGLTVDAEGGIWLALHAGGAVRRYRPDGALAAEIEVPVSSPTACTFGGPGLRTLYITTSALGLPPGREPAAGSVFRCEPGVAGLPVHPYRG